MYQRDQDYFGIEKFNTLASIQIKIIHSKNYPIQELISLCRYSNVRNIKTVSFDHIRYYLKLVFWRVILRNNLDNEDVTSEESQKTGIFAFFFDSSSKDEFFHFINHQENIYKNILSKKTTSFLFYYSVNDAHFPFYYMLPFTYSEKNLLFVFSEKLKTLFNSFKDDKINTKKEIIEFMNFIFKQDSNLKEKFGNENKFFDQIRNNLMKKYDPNIDNLDVLLNQSVLNSIFISMVFNFHFNKNVSIDFVSIDSQKNQSKSINYL